MTSAVNRVRVRFPLLPVALVVLSTLAAIALLFATGSVTAYIAATAAGSIASLTVAAVVADRGRRHIDAARTPGKPQRDPRGGASRSDRSE